MYRAKAEKIVWKTGPMQAGTSNGRTQVVSRESVGFLLFFSKVGFDSTEE